VSLSGRAGYVLALDHKSGLDVLHLRAERFAGSILAPPARLSGYRLIAVFAGALPSTWSVLDRRSSCSIALRSPSQSGSS